MKRIGEVYSALASLLGLELKKLNKVTILREALKFIRKHHKLDFIDDSLVEIWGDEDLPSFDISNLKVSTDSQSDHSISILYFDHPDF